MAGRLSQYKIIRGLSQITVLVSVRKRSTEHILELYKAGRFFAYSKTVTKPGAEHRFLEVQVTA